VSSSKNAGDFCRGRQLSDVAPVIIYDAAVPQPLLYQCLRVASSFAAGLPITGNYLWHRSAYF
jgi:hypothetical protein